jgi:hypothetical protein
MALTQVEKVRRYLAAKGEIDIPTAKKLFGITSLSGRIGEMRGLPVVKDVFENALTGEIKTVFRVAPDFGPYFSKAVM